jgi:hypothetical protein
VWLAPPIPNFSATTISTSYFDIPCLIFDIPSVIPSAAQESVEECLSVLAEQFKELREAQKQSRLRL